MSRIERPLRLHPAPVRGQRGISLFLVMTFLVILSILGVTAIQGSGLSARIAGNEADRTLAFQAAESALRDAEKDIRGVCTTNCRSTPISPETSDIFDTPCAFGLCLPSAVTATPVWEVKDNWTANKSAALGQFTGTPALPVVSQQPRYLIEYFKVGESFIYRVTAIGYGARDTTQVMLQSSVKAL